MSEIPKLRWRCRRGMKELDLVLTRYLDQCYPTAPEAERAAFRQVLEMQDLDLAKGDSELHLTIRNLPLVPGRYRIAGGMRRDGEVLGWAKEMSRVSVSLPDGIRIGAGKMIFRAERLEVTRCDL